MRPRVLVTSRQQGDALEDLTAFADVDLWQSPEPMPARELKSRLASCDAVVCLLTDNIDSEVVEGCPALKVVANVAVGYDNVDLGELCRRDILLTNTPGVLDETTADLAFALLLAAARRVAEADRFVRSGSWSRWDPELMLGVDVYGKTIGIVGYGRIGRAVARRARGFSMRVLYTRSEPPPASLCPDETGALHVSLDTLMREADFISVHCPLDSRTRHLVGAQQLDLVKKGCILVNTARGPVVDEAALVEALLSGKLRAAALDVFEREPAVPAELTAMDNVVLAPHIGSATVETRAAMASLAVRSVKQAFAGVMPPNLVNREIWPRFLARLA